MNRNNRRLKEEEKKPVQGKEGVAHIEITRESTTPIWYTIYADMMTNLTLFFLMMFALNKLKTSEREAVTRAIQKEFSGKKMEVVEMYDKQKEMENKVKEIVEKDPEQRIAQIKISEERIKIMLRSPVLFDSAKADLKPEALPILHEIAALIRDIPNAIIVEGHTDDIPISRGKFRSNWELSAARAFGVIDYFVRSEDILPERLSAVGYGENRPLQPNDTEEHRAVNRRIEINIVNIP